MCIRDSAYSFYNYAFSLSNNDISLENKASEMNERCRKAVSYTHLDVYKRQPVWGVVPERERYVAGPQEAESIRLEGWRAACFRRAGQEERKKG